MVSVYVDLIRYVFTKAELLEVSCLCSMCA